MYIVNRFGTDKKINKIRFKSRVLDSIFRYKYHYIDLAREGVNLSEEETEIYKIPFSICGRTYDLRYYIGHNKRIGLFNSYKIRGKASIHLKTAEIEACYRITLLLERFSQF
ncbi:MAG: hypothetical protein CVU95_15580 [Firmicutes bacterium HGW-Firmicutes-2]|jgi:hypothetical protein|nr:MAG: hypothetical protein CVU95_15580 [Firmicutes bacterium HGW-Firmicutes-2]